VPKWQSLDSGRSVIAPFGTRVGVLVGLPINTNPENVDITEGESKVDLPPSDDVSWRFNITPGTLIDAKDEQNLWYQVSPFSSSTVPSKH
jgi:hypothetical protein